MLFHFCSLCVSFPIFFRIDLYFLQVYLLTLMDRVMLLYAKEGAGEFIYHANWQASRSGCLMCNDDYLGRRVAR